jgi:hypothetical protein
MLDLATVLDRSLGSDTLTLDTHLTAAARLVDLSQPEPRPQSAAQSARTASPLGRRQVGDAGFDLDQVVEVTVRAAFVSMQQLEIALRLTLDSTQRTQLVVRLVDRAGAAGASPGGVGAAALLLDVVRDDGLDRAVRVAANAVVELGARELLDGSVALVASLSVEIAGLLHIEPAAVSLEIVRLAAGLPAGPVVPPDDRRRVTVLAV